MHIPDPLIKQLYREPSRHRHQPSPPQHWQVDRPWRWRPDWATGVRRVARRGARPGKRDVARHAHGRSCRETCRSYGSEQYEQSVKTVSDSSAGNTGYGVAVKGRCAPLNAEVFSALLTRQIPQCKSENCRWLCRLANCACLSTKDGLRAVCASGRDDGESWVWRQVGLVQEHLARWS